MRSVVQRMPRWAAILLGAVAAGIVWAGGQVLLNELLGGNDSWLEEAVFGFATGLIFGLVFIPRALRRERRAAEQTGLESERLKRAQRASAGGKVPTDPEILRSARALGADQLARLEAQRVWLWLLSALQVLGAAVMVWIAFDVQKPWIAVFGVFFVVMAVMAVMVVVKPQRLRRRLAVLDAAIARANNSAAVPRHWLRLPPVH